jgi:exodeoxyribonuclease-3
LRKRKGYSGVGVYSRHEPSEVIAGFGSAEFDAEGRYLELRFDTPKRALSIISAYFPSGSSGPERQEAKYRFLDVFRPHLDALHPRRRKFVLCGDVNIAHQQIDLKNWRSNQKNSGFLPLERQWVTELLQEGNLVDVYRRLEPDGDRCGLHLVEQPGAGLCKERRVAAGLPAGQPLHRGQGP